MTKNFTLTLLALVALSALGWSDPAQAGRGSSGAAGRAVKIEDDVVQSPFKACQGVVIVDRDKYKRNESKWKEWEANCNGKRSVQLTGLEDKRNAVAQLVDPLQESVQYLDFTKSVVEQSLAGLAKSRAYAECSKRCFSDPKASCETEEKQVKKVIACSTRIQEVRDGLNTYSVRARVELALATDNLKARNINASNIMSTPTEDLLNHDMRGFTLTGVANPFQGVKLLDREKKRASEIWEKEKKAVIDEFDRKHPKSSMRNAAISNLLADKLAEHQMKYARIVYEEVPIFGVIEKPSKYDDTGRPQWTDEQIAQAFGKLIENADKVRPEMQADMGRGKLEFDRYNLEAVQKWFANSLPGSFAERDLLSYMALTGQVNEVLKKDPSKCGIATTLINRIGTKDLQNMGMSFVATGGVMGVVGKGGAAAATASQAGRTIAATMKVFGTGLVMSSPYMFEAFKKPEDIYEQMATRSGVGGDQEGTALRTVEDLEQAQSGRTMSGVFAIATPGIGALAKAGSSSISNIFANAALRGELKNAGVEADTARKMVSLANSARVDASTRLAAKSEIDQFLTQTRQVAEKQLGDAAQDPGLNRVADAMVKQGVGTPEQLRHFAQTAEVLGLKTAAEKDAYYNRVFNLWENSMKGRPKATPAEKAAVLDSIAALTRLGYANETEILKILKDPKWGGQSLEGVAAVVNQASDSFVKAVKDGKVSDLKKVAEMREAAFRDAYAQKAFGRTEAQLRADVDTAQADIDRLTRQMGVTADKEKAKGELAAAQAKRDQAKRDLDEVGPACQCVAMCARGGKARASIGTPGEPLATATTGGVYLACTTDNRDLLSQF